MFLTKQLLSRCLVVHCWIRCEHQFSSRSKHCDRSREKSTIWCTPALPNNPGLCYFALAIDRLSLIYVLDRHADWDESNNSHFTNHRDTSSFLLYILVIHWSNDLKKHQFCVRPPSRDSYLPNIFSSRRSAWQFISNQRSLRQVHFFLYMFSLISIHTLSEIDSRSDLTRHHCGSQSYFLFSNGFSKVRQNSSSPSHPSSREIFFLLNVLDQ